MEGLTEYISIPINVYKSLIGHETAVYILRSLIKDCEKREDSMLDLSVFRAILRMDNFEPECGKGKQNG